MPWKKRIFRTCWRHQLYLCGESSLFLTPLYILSCSSDEKIVHCCFSIKRKKKKRKRKHNAVHNSYWTTCKNLVFECWYIRTHDKEKPSKISNKTLTILPSNKKKSQAEWLSWVLWNLLLVLFTKPSDTLQNESF